MNPVSKSRVSRGSGRALWLAAVAVVAAAGCGSTGLAPFTNSGSLADERLGAEHRERFQRDGDPESLRWLLANRVATGMSLAEVNHVLGEEGERLYDAARLKRGVGRYHENDEFYKWGPGSDGRSVYLAFRDDRLLHFDPEEFADEPPL